MIFVCFIFARYTIMWLFLYMHMHNKNEEHKWENYWYLLINEYLLKAYFHFYHIKACSELSTSTWFTILFPRCMDICPKVFLWRNAEEIFVSH